MTIAHRPPTPADLDRQLTELRTRRLLELDKLIAAFTTICSIDYRVDVLLDRRNDYTRGS